MQEPQCFATRANYEAKMAPRLQWVILVLVVAAAAGYFVYAGGSGPCGTVAALRQGQCQHSSGSRPTYGNR